MTPTIDGKPSSASRNGLLVDHIDWKSYTRLLRVFANRPGYRLAYDRGRLEIMSPYAEHEFDKQLLDRLVVALTEELNMNVKAGGSTTFRSKSKRRGIEADNCYWIANEHKIRGKRRINLKVDPPPDLAIEVDVTSSSLDRLSIHAALKIPEIWRLQGNAVEFHVLGSDSKYAASEVSLAFPGLKASDLITFLTMQAHADDNAIVRQFRAFVQKRIGESWK